MDARGLLMSSICSPDGLHIPKRVCAFTRNKLKESKSKKKGSLTRASAVPGPVLIGRFLFMGKA
ncbi:protein of unknown function [Vibrio tapetis subsp. tapetis]|uniref:Uncharacterized protein n=1 Tax=Vibrio tapetis subsp. tapetis TaxID=1671868 RepID=A0A2N8ZI16_9VIBR|nr:protein of unknown function [Vibrio tapetis subsp. tapetis]